MGIGDRSLFKAATAVLAAVTLLAAGMPNDEHLVDWVQKRVRELQPSRAERRIDDIGWAHGILEAEGLGRTLNRPVFLFTHDGRIETGRC
ncbi:MAG TPA: hypothetical protein VKJ01_21915 [Candidatus Solibacter sp.]|jgi:hypothetical protein|nr:hypothetical protein [Candidatus Solibacter sp.]